MNHNNTHLYSNSPKLGERLLCQKAHQEHQQHHPWYTSVHATNSNVNFFFVEGSNVNLLSQHYRLLIPAKNHKCNKLLEGLSNLDIVLLHKFQNEIGCWFRAYTCVGNILVACFPCSPPRDVINCGYDIKLSKFEI